MLRQVITLLLTLFTISGFAQDVMRGKIIAIPPDSGYKKFEARDHVVLGPGYSFKATPGNSMYARIVDTLILPVSYNTGADYSSPDFDPATRQLDFSLPVGSINGAGEVDQMGTATYNIPIAIPPGTNGMQPVLGIQYSSSGGNGILGARWSLTGLQSIHRASQTIVRDSRITGINNTSEDRFALNGVRLVQAAGQFYGGNGSEYHTEMETFAKIISRGVSGSGPAWFEVHLKNGQVLEFGRTDDSKVRDQSTDNIVAWLINKVSDPFGNYLTYSYRNNRTTGEVVISEIAYTGNEQAGLQPYNKVKFFYEKREDPSVAFVGGTKLSSTLLLHHIRVYCENMKVREYAFNYKLDKFSKLNEITQGISESQHFNSTVIKWDNKSAAVSKSFHFTPNDGKDKWIFGDFNGDGATDIFKIRQRNDTVLQYPTGERWDLLTFDGSNFVPVKDGTIGSDVFSVDHAGDYNADGIDDLLLTHIHQANPQNPLLFNVEFSAWTIDRFSTQLIRVTPVFSEQNITLQNVPAVLPLDFTGIGKANFALVSPYFNGNINVNIFGSDGSSSMGYGTLKSKENHVIDFNGNGKADLLNITGTEVTVQEYPNLINAAMDFICTQNFSEFARSKVFPGDFNGDAKSDLLAYDSTSWRIYYSNGKSFESGIAVPELNSLLLFTDADTLIESVEANHVKIADLNGDGLSDIVIHSTFKNRNWSAVQVPEAPSYDLYVYESMDIFFNSYNGAFTREHLYEQAGNHVVHYNITKEPGPYLIRSLDILDFNKDNSPDLFFNRYVANNGSPLYTGEMYCYRPFDNSDKVRSITDGMNLTCEFTYKLQSLSAYLPPAFPLFSVTRPMLVATGKKVYSGNRCFENESFEYYGPKAHRLGRGFLGFGDVIRYDSLTNFKTWSRYRIESQYKLPLLDRVTRHLGYQTLDEVVYAHRVHNGIAGAYSTFYIYSDTTVTIDYLPEIEGGQRSETSIIVELTDNFGNIGKRITEIKGEETLTETFSGYQAKGSWCPSRPTQKQSATVRTGQPSYNRTIQYVHDSRGFLTRETWDEGKSKAVTHLYAPNVFGQPVSTTTFSAGLPDKIGSVQYDAKGRAAERITNAIGNSKLVKYDFRWGVPLEERDINGLVTQYSYDEFGRKTGTTLPSGIKLFTQKAWTVNEGPQFSLYKVISGGDGLPDAVEFYDVLGRSTGKELETFAGEKIVTQMEYNTRGEVARKLLPKFVQGPEQWVTLSYDEFGRALQASTPATTFENSYAGLSVQTKNLGDPHLQSKTKKYFPSGKLKETLDTRGTPVSYTYNSMGQPVATTSFSGDLEKSINTEYDEYGHQTKLIDPDAGEIEYRYNAYGQLEYQKNGNGFEDSSSYDAIGRLVFTIDPNGRKTSYTYVTGNNGKELLEKVTAPDGHEVTLSYDRFARLSSRSELIEGELFTTKYEYDLNNRLVKTTYPSGISVENVYDDKGTLVQVRSGANVIWELLRLNHRGQVIEFRSGNGLITKLGYDEHGRPSSLFTPGIQNWSYKFTVSNGNLEYKVDSINNFKEEYFYDNLDRLYLQKDNKSGATVSLQYADNGNILRNFDEVFKYKPSRPTAVSEYHYHPTAGSLPAAVQDITYTWFNQPETITERGNKLEFIYGYDQQRRKTRLFKQGQLAVSKTFLGAYEKEVTSAGARELHYIGGLNGLSAILVNENNQQKIYYVYSDHQGTLQYVTDESGSKLQEYSFDAWGRRRDPATGQRFAENTIDSITAGYLFDRGYTGHEHLDEFALVNMNGRLYDPVLMHMLSPDNFVPDATSAQSYNRYAYALNNPTKYIDSDGELPIIVIYAAIVVVCGTINVIAHADQIHSFQDGLVAFGIGAAAGAVAILISPVAAPGAVAYASASGMLTAGVTGVVGAGVSTTIMGTGNHLYFGDPMPTAEDYSISMALGFSFAIYSYTIQSAIPRTNVPYRPEVEKMTPRQVEPLPSKASDPANASARLAAREATIQEAGMIDDASGLIPDNVDFIPSEPVKMAKSLDGQWVDDAGNIKWPPNNGFAGAPEKLTLQTGMRIDRYGLETGRFVAPEGVPSPMRALAPGTETAPYSVYEVVKPVNALGGKAAPWFGQPGGGMQYQFDMTIEQLRLNGYLIKIR